MKEYLLQALAAADERRGFCAPNPAVGAVIVKNNNVIARGAHWAAGCAHAEVDALQKAGEAAEGATLFVTLEPCCHHGKTPPCTEAIINAKIKKVVFAFADPHDVASHGRDKLIAAGVECEQLELPEINAFYRSYAYWLAHQRPWVRLKLALSADNKIANADSSPVQISGEACAQFTQQQRLRSDALLTTAKTVLNDNPQMNVRLPEKTIAKKLFVLDQHLQLDKTAEIFKTADSVTLYHAEGLEPSLDLDYVPVACDEYGLSLAAVLDDIGKKGIHDLWVEVGARAFRSFYQQQLINQLIFYRSKQMLGDAAMPAFIGFNPLEEHNWEQRSLGEDEVLSLTWDFVADRFQA